MRTIKLIFMLLALSGILLPLHADEENWVATSSSVEENYSPQLAIDGDTGSRWSSQFLDDQWWMVDFGKQKEIHKITLYWEDAYTVSYKILVSSNGTSWDRVYETANGKGGQEVIRITPVQTRYVKLQFSQRATKWGNSLWEVKFNEPDPVPMTAKASTGDSDYAAGRAVDGNMKSRWSSSFEDNQWWQVEFKKPQSLCGITIYWETAYGEKYNIQVSEDGNTWKTVYETEDGDGNTDIIYFRPTDARSLRFNGIQRGTGWGFSFWEVTFQRGDNPPVLTASSFNEGSAAELAMDGDNATAWHSGAGAQSQIEIKLPETLKLGGLLLTWGDDYATSYAVEVSADGTNWQQVFKTDESNGKKDWIFFPAARARKIRINCNKDNAGKGYALAEVELKSSEEQASPIKNYQAAAKDSPPGLYPMWLRRIQEFWTVVGVADDTEESLLSESGSFEPYKDGFTVMPFVYDGKRLYSSEDCKYSQSLLEDTLPLPTVKWDHGDWTLETSALAFGAPEQSCSVVRYRFKNIGKEPFKGKFAVAILPVQLNPQWQRGGFSPIKSISYDETSDVSEIRINDQRRIVLATKPIKMGAVPFEKGDVIDYIKKGTLPDSSSAGNADGATSAGLLYDLNVSPGSNQDFVVIFPLHPLSYVPQRAMQNSSAFFDSQLELERKQWSEHLNHFTIKIPEKRLIDVMKSNIAYILINKDGPWIKPGPRNYNHSWVRDGAMTSVALLRMGFISQVKSWLDAVTPHIKEMGFVPFIFFDNGNPVGFNTEGSGEGQEYDSQGEYIFAVRQYIDFSGDKGYLERVYPTVVRVLKFAQQLRRQRMTSEYQNDPKKQPYYGILPQSNSHEGYFPAMHSYWDDFWVLRGFKDGVYLAKLIGRNDDAEWMQKEAEDLRKCIYESIKKVISRDRINYIPGCVEKGDFDATSTAIAIVACGEKNYLPQPYLKNTFDRYFDEFSKGMKPGNERTFTPYEVRSANAFIRMGERERGLTMLRYFTKDSVRPYGWNHMAEVVYAKPRTPGYIGDMPHTWVGSGYIDSVRTIFAYELENQLMLGAGIDPVWLNDGVEVKGLPTLYGKINYTIRRKDNAIEFYVDGTAKPPAGFMIPLPESLKSYKLEKDTGVIRLEKGGIRFSNLPVQFKIYNPGHPVQKYNRSEELAFFEKM